MVSPLKVKNSYSGRNDKEKKLLQTKKGTLPGAFSINCLF